MKNVYKLMLLVAVMLVSVTTNANKKSIYKIAPQLTTSQRIMKKAKPAKTKKAIAQQFSQMRFPDGRITKAAPAAKKATVNITATNLEDADFSILFGEYAYYIGASTDTYEVCLWLNTTTFAGTYKTADLDTDESYIANGENYYMITSLNITATEVQGTKTVTGTAVCEDGNTYNLNLTYVKPTKTSQESITVSNAELADETAADGFFEATGFNATGSRYVAVCVYSDKIAGTYTTDDCDSYYTYVAKLGKDTVYYDLVDADLKVTMVGENTAEITGTLLCQSEVNPNDVPEFTISMTCNIDAGGTEGLEYDVEDDDFSATFTDSDEIMIDTDYFDEYGVITIDAATADHTKTIGLGFNVSKKDDKIIIPEGVYPITNTYEAGTVTASEGVDDEGYVTYSYAGTVNGEGYIEDVWFLVGGTVTVSNDNGKLKVVVNGLNSNNCEVVVNLTTTVSITPDPTPGENLVENGSFEEWASDAQPTGWEGWQITELGNSGGAVLSKTTDSKEGDYACLVKGDTKNKRLSTKKLTLKAGKYNVQFYAKSAATEGGIKPGYATKQANGDAAYTYIYGDDLVALSSDWKKIAYDFTLAETTDIAMIVMNYKNSGDCIIDDYKLWLDGSAPSDTIDPPLPMTDIIYSIDFTKGMEPWTIENKTLGEGLEYVWKQDSKFGMKASAFVNKVNIPSESWIVSPEIDLTGVTKASMTMNHAVNFTTTPTNYLSVKVSTDKQNWENVQVSPWPAGNSWDYNEASATLDKYAGKKVYVAFVYTSDNNAAPTWEIDKFEVTGENQDVPPTPITTEIYSIDYTKGMEPWVIENKSLAEGLEYVWKQDSKYGMKASAFVNKVNMPSESWLVSPEIDLSNVATACMQINHAVNFTTTPTKYLSVKVSTDKQTWDNIEVSPWPAGNSWDYNKATATLDKYAGKKIYVAFVYTSDSNAAPTWEIDTFQVTGESGSKVLRGDADVDGEVTVADITTIAAYILGGEPASFNTENADANADGNIDVSDITTTAGIILGN